MWGGVVQEPALGGKCPKAGVPWSHLLRGTLGLFRWLCSLLAGLWLAQCAYRHQGLRAPCLGEGLLCCQVVLAALDGVLEPGLMRPLMSSLWEGQCWLPGWGPQRGPCGQWMVRNKLGVGAGQLWVCSCVSAGGQNVP